jgi:hypothetical protein
MTPLARRLTALEDRLSATDAPAGTELTEAMLSAAQARVDACAAVGARPDPLDMAAVRYAEAFSAQAADPCGGGHAALAALTVQDLRDLEAFILREWPETAVPPPRSNACDMTAWEVSQ